MRKRMHRRDDAAARDEGAEERESEGHPDEREVPHLQHVLAFLDHHGMEVRGHHEPRHEGGVFDRVPCPVTAPSEDFVRPARAEEIAERQEEPGEDRPSAGAANPCVVEAAGYQRCGAEGERYARADVAGVERRRMNRHPIILEQRVQILAVGRNRREHIERARDEVQHPEEEDREARQHRERIRRDFGIAAAVLEGDDRRKDREQPRPQQQRALLAAP